MQDIIDVGSTADPVVEPIIVPPTEVKTPAPEHKPPAELDISKLPISMRQALLARRIADDWEGRPE